MALDLFSYAECHAERFETENEVHNRLQELVSKSCHMVVGFFSCHDRRTDLEAVASIIELFQNSVFWKLNLQGDALCNLDVVLYGRNDKLAQLDRFSNYEERIASFLNALELNDASIAVFYVVDRRDAQYSQYCSSVLRMPEDIWINDFPQNREKIFARILSEFEYMIQPLAEDSDISSFLHGELEQDINVVAICFLFNRKTNETSMKRNAEKTGSLQGRFGNTDCQFYSNLGFEDFLSINFFLIDFTIFDGVDIIWLLLRTIAPVTIKALPSQPVIVTFRRKPLPRLL